MSRGYDLIGDIHGCAKTLIRLLEQMGYRKQSGVYQHPQRQVIFVGDIVDRGPRIREALHLVRDMVERGNAQMIMGNHEYNLLTYCTPAPESFGRPYLREHSQRNTFVVQATLDQFAAYPQEFKEFLSWFYELPLFLELPECRVVHACWDAQLIARFRQQVGGDKLSLGFLEASARQGSFEHDFIDRILRGTSLELPEGRAITSRDGLVRRFFRTKFWLPEPKTYGDVLFQPDPLPEDLVDQALSDEEHQQLICYGADEPPLFIGHYWMSGLPEPITHNIACLDYSAVKYGHLVAYRLDGEQQLNWHKFDWVRVEKSDESLDH